MKKIFVLLFLGAIMTATAKDLKVLMIGNSFSICVGRNLPQLVAHEKKHTIDITSAYIGGCILQRHVENLNRAEKDPSFKPYTINTWNSKNLRKKGQSKGNVNELLKNNKYDIITIQQGSTESWDYKFYQPYANELIQYIRKYNQQAEIVIQQTWAYRADAPRLKRWKFSQTEMSDKIITAYNELAKATNFRLIPTGEAVAIARKSPKYKYEVLSPEQLKKFTYPNLPPRTTDVVGKHFWSKNKKGVTLAADTIHLNKHGEYLQACLWYGFLFNEDPEKITYTPKIAAENCAILRKCAAEALKKYQK